MQTTAQFSAWMLLLSIVAGYLIGNIQTAIIISKFHYHDDVRNHGSGNAGSTNMVRVFGYRPGLLTFAGDFSKAVLAVLVGRWLMGTYGGYLAGFSVVIGHCYPVFAGFRGGKGVASSFGVAWMVFPLGAAITTVVILVVLALSKRVSLMSLIGIAAFFITTLLFKWGTDMYLILLAFLLLAVVYLRHTDNIKRLLHGEEKQLVN